MTALHILYLEQLAADMACVVRRYGLPGEMANITKTNKTHGKATRVNLNATARKLVEEVYADDFQNFGYPIMRSSDAT